MSKAKFIAHVERDFVPVLREAGFDGQGLCWRRLREPFIDCVDIQSRSDDAACCVNLGEHLTFLPIAGGSSAPDIEAMTLVDCELNNFRLKPSGFKSIREIRTEVLNSRRSNLKMVAAIAGLGSVLLADVFLNRLVGHVAAGRHKVPACPQMPTPILFLQMPKLHQQLSRTLALDVLHNFAGCKVRWT